MGDQTTPTLDEAIATSDAEPGAASNANAGAGDNNGQEGTGEQQSGDNKPRVYSEEEWNKRQSALDVQAAQAKKGYEEQLTSVLREQQALKEQLEQGKYQSFLKQVEEAGGDMDLAKRLVVKEQELSRLESDFRVRDTNLKKLQTELDGTAKAIAARDLIAKYELPKEVVDELLKAKDPVEMKATALEMALAKTKSTAVKSTKTVKSTDSTKGIDLSKMTLDQRLNWILAHKNTVDEKSIPK